MRLNHGVIALMLSATALASTSAMTGCAGGGLVYNSYWDDSHPWNHDEDRFYWQWETETRRGHLDFRRRSRGDQREYWAWRQKFPTGR